MRCAGCFGYGGESKGEEEGEDEGGEDEGGEDKGRIRDRRR